MPFPSVFGSLWTPHRAAAWTALFLFLLTASAYFCGVNAKRALQQGRLYRSVYCALAAIFARPK